MKFRNILFVLISLFILAGCASATISLDGWKCCSTGVVENDNVQNLSGQQVKLVLQGNDPGAPNYIDFNATNGSDIRVIDSDKTTLIPSIIESWNSSTKNAIIWMNISNVAVYQKPLYFLFSTFPSYHNDYGLSYPVTYEFSIPSASSNLKVYKKYTQSENWTLLPEKTRNDFFNAIEAVRFDYPNNTAYVSVAFDSNSNDIYLKIVDVSNNQVGIYKKIDNDYDNRTAVVVSSSDDNFIMPSSYQACDMMTAKKIWYTPGIITDIMTSSLWNDLQGKIDAGYVEPASHSRTHINIPYTDYIAEINGSKDDILTNLVMPALDSKGSSEYLYTFIEPFGDSDAAARHQLGVSKYLVDRDISDNWSAKWDYKNGLYDRVGYSIRMGNDGTVDPAILNASFDTAYKNRGIYHLMCHPDEVDWNIGQYADKHTSYIGGRKDIWYAGLGHLYLYNFIHQFASIKTATSGKTVYIYYGNSNVSSASSFDDVFTKDYNDTGLVGCWHMDEKSGSILTDSSGFGNSGNITNAKWTSTDGGQWGDRSDMAFQKGSELQFNGASSYVNLGKGESLNQSSAFTVEAWVNSTTLSGSGTIVGKESSTSSSNGMGYYLTRAGNKFEFDMYDNKKNYIALTSPEISANTNYHVVVVYDGNYMYLYLNGVKFAQTSINGFCPAPTYDMTIGKLSYTDADYFSGTIDEVREYSRALSDDEILDHYQRRKYTFLEPSATIDAAPFNASSISGTSPFQVQFSDLSGAASRAWDFENDGHIDSTQQNPVYIYTTPGNYSVNLTVNNKYGTFSTLKMNYITVSQGSVIADFISNVTGGNAPLTVQFTDNTTGGGPYTWNWNFGDGTNSTEQNPKHTYYTAGNYTVALTATNAAGSNTKTKPNYIQVTVSTQNPIVNFTSNVTSGIAPLTVQFNDSSLNATTWNWNFGDGVTISGNNSSTKNPMHNYVAAGIYTVNLTVSNANGTASKLATINVSAQQILPVANFRSNVTSGIAPLTVQFDDSSLYATGWNWNFGDGTNSTQQNPIHTYSTAGSYTVNLTVSNGNGTDSKLAIIIVSNSSNVPTTVANQNILLLVHGPSSADSELPLIQTPLNSWGYQTTVFDYTEDYDLVHDSAGGDHWYLHYVSGANGHGDLDLVTNGVMNYNVIVFGATSPLAYTDIENSSRIVRSMFEAYAFLGIVRMENGYASGSTSNLFQVGVSGNSNKILNISNPAGIWALEPLKNYSLDFTGSDAYNISAKTSNVTVLENFTDRTPAITLANYPTGAKAIYFAFKDWGYTQHVSMLVRLLQQYSGIPYKKPYYSYELDDGGEIGVPNTDYLNLVNFTKNNLGGYPTIALMGVSIDSNPPANIFAWGQNPSHYYNDTRDYNPNMSSLMTILKTCDDYVIAAHGYSHDRDLWEWTSTGLPVDGFADQDGDGIVNWLDDSIEGGINGIPNNNNPRLTLFCGAEFADPNLTFQDRHLSRLRDLFNSNGLNNYHVMITPKYIHLNQSDSLFSKYGFGIVSGMVGSYSGYTIASGFLNGSFAPGRVQPASPGDYPDIALSPTEDTEFKNSFRGYIGNSPMCLIASHPLQMQQGNTSNYELRDSRLPGYLIMKTAGYKLVSTQSAANKNKGWLWTTMSSSKDSYGNINLSLNSTTFPDGATSHELDIVMPLNISQAILNGNYLINVDNNTLYIGKQSGTNITVQIKNGTYNTSLPRISSVSTPATDMLISNYNSTDGKISLGLNGSFSTSIGITNFNKPFFRGITTIDSTGNSKLTLNPNGEVSFDSINASIVPSSDTVDITVNAWKTSGDYLKSWNESSSNHTVSSTHIIGDFPANSTVVIYRDGVSYTSVISNLTGYINWIYSGGYGEHQFNASLYNVQGLQIADFNSNVTNGSAPLSVQFIDQSKNATAWDWSFGDGTNSTQQNPMHTYSTAGYYTVALTVINAAGSNTTIKPNYIQVTVAVQNPVANFTSNITSGIAPLTVQFNDSSLNATTWNWNFGDGATISGNNSSTKNPMHTYVAAGTYTANLTVSNTNGTASKLATINVSAQTTLPVANFSSNVTQGLAPLTVQFNDSSLYASTWNWNFGDGATLSGNNSSTRNPLHTYISTGTYTANLTVSNANGTSSKTATINVNLTPVLPVANFSSNVTQGLVPLSVQFLDQSKNATGWNWSFGDGANSTQQNPSHTYSSSGIYTVNLTASNANGMDSKLAKINVLKIYAYITNRADNAVSVIDIVTNNVTATVQVGNNPQGVAVNSAGTKIYVTNSNDKTVSEINIATNNVTATVQVGNNPQGVAVNPAGTKVYVTNQGSDNVSVIDAATKKVIATIKVGDKPHGIAVNPAGTKVYVANMGSGTVSVIDTAINNVTATVTVGKSPLGVAVNPAGTKVYVTNSASNNVSVIDTATNNITAMVTVGGKPQGVAVNFTGTKVYVTNSNDKTVSVINTATNVVTATVKVGNNPQGVAVNPAGTKVYVANMGSNTVSVIDTATNTVAATVQVGNRPSAFGQFIVPPTV